MKVLKLSDSKREHYHEAFGKVIIISKDEYGGLVDFVEILDNEESELDHMVVSTCQLDVLTSCPIG